MRVSFDIDDTLVCGTAAPTEQFVPWWKRWWYPELLRRGTRTLMQELLRLQCQLWIYTTSYRPPRYLRGWFGSTGVPIYGVVNQHRHERVVGRHGPSKYPPAFGIDLHVDDSEGVAEEARQHHFRVVVVSPEDLEWTTRVLEAVKRQSHVGTHE
jgi:FMN phosphatase YigB (HAD superfamily)